MTQFKGRIFLNVCATITYLISLSKVTHLDGMLNLSIKPTCDNFFKIKFEKKKRKKDELTALFQLRNEYRGNLKYTLSSYPVDLKCRVVGPFCSGAVEEITFQKMKFRRSHKNILMYKVYRDVSCVKYLNFCSGLTTVTFTYCKYQVLMLQCCS